MASRAMTNATYITPTSVTIGLVIGGPVAGEVYEQDFGPDTSQRVSAINFFNPDKRWEKADATPP